MAKPLSDHFREFLERFGNTAHLRLMVRITKVDIRIVLSPNKTLVFHPVGKSMKIYLEGRGRKSRWLVPEEEQEKILQLLEA